MNGIPAKIVHPLGKKNRKKLRYDPDPYAKRTARRVAATPALQSNPVGPAGRTPQARACRRLEYPHLAEPSNATLKSFAKAIAVSPQIHTYAELRQQIHDDLRIQHPEWLEPNGESSMCLLEELDALTRRGSTESIAAPHRALEQGLNRI